MLQWYKNLNEWHGENIFGFSGGPQQVKGKTKSSPLRRKWGYCNSNKTTEPEKRSSPL